MERLAAPTVACAHEVDALTVVAPRRLDVDRLVRRDTLDTSPVSAHDANVEICIACIHRQRDSFAVGAPRRLEVVTGPGCECHSLAALRWDLPDVASHGEGDPASIR